MMHFVLYTGIAVFGLICLIRPQVLLKRRNRDEEDLPKDIRFFRILGGVLVGLYLLGYGIQFVISRLG